MGYQRKLYRLKFDDPALEGLEVVTRPVPLAEILDLAEEAEALSKGAASREAVAKMADLLTSCMVSWTVEDEDGNPAPVPEKGADLLAEDAQVAMAILNGWADQLIRVAPPLPKNSSDGPGSALEPLLPMAPLSPSHANSGAPG